MSKALLILFLLTHLSANASQVPRFVSQVPPEHFAGISAPADDLASARKSAVADVVRQILGTISAEYNHHSLDLIAGTLPHVKRHVKDQLRRESSGIVLDVEQNIVRSVSIKDRGHFVCFILVHYPETKIREMRRLSRGAKVCAWLLSKDDDQLQVQLREINNVSASISTAEMFVHKSYRLADIYNFCIWKVPENATEHMTIGLDPIQLKNSSHIISLPLQERGIKDVLLGASTSGKIRLKGVDQSGHPLQVTVRF
ncbi:MAG: hypothetical protein U5L00_07270 [Desulfovermiculus sp.]|nr:hypothetical protein [Desulfovermiculus sp.]